jgi:hypothetical protein
MSAVGAVEPDEERTKMTWRKFRNPAPRFREQRHRLDVVVASPWQSATSKPSAIVSSAACVSCSTPPSCRSGRTAQ